MREEKKSARDLHIQVIGERREEPIQEKGASGSMDITQDKNSWKLLIMKVHVAEKGAIGLKLVTHSVAELKQEMAALPVQ